MKAALTYWLRRRVWKQAPRLNGVRPSWMGHHGTGTVETINYTVYVVVDVVVVYFSSDRTIYYSTSLVYGYALVIASLHEPLFVIAIYDYIVIEFVFNLFDRRRRRRQHWNQCKCQHELYIYDYDCLWHYIILFSILCTSHVFRIGNTCYNYQWNQSLYCIPTVVTTSTVLSFRTRLRFFWCQSSLALCRWQKSKRALDN